MLHSVVIFWKQHTSVYILIMMSSPSTAGACFYSTIRELDITSTGRVSSVGAQEMRINENMLTLLVAGMTNPSLTWEIVVVIRRRLLLGKGAWRIVSLEKTFCSFPIFRTPTTFDSRPDKRSLTQTKKNIIFCASFFSEFLAEDEKDFFCQRTKLLS